MTFPSLHRFSASPRRARCAAASFALAVAIALSVSTPIGVTARAAQDPPAARPPIPAIHDGVVVDAAGETAFIMTLDGNVQAVNLADGSIKWTQSTTAKPLALVDRTLLAQAPPGSSGELVLVTLDAATGASQQRMDVALPAGARALLTDGPSERFHVRPFAGENAAAVVLWTYEASPLKGVLGAPEMEETAEAMRTTISVPRNTDGGIRVDVTAGRATSLSTAEAEDQIRTTPSADAVARDASAARAATPATRQFRSVDDRHVLHSTRSSDPARWWTPYRWTITDAAGETVGAADAPVSMAPFAVAGTRLFYVAHPTSRRSGDTVIAEALRLRALDLRAGTELWAIPVADTLYRGPLPP